MLIQNLSLKNFKCFEEVDVEFAPITLLTGANSSGKSSLIYSLLAVLQTEQFPFYLSPNGKYVNLGSFEEMVYKKEIDKKIEIGISPFLEIYRFRLPPPEHRFQWIWAIDILNFLPKLESLLLMFEELSLVESKFQMDVKAVDKNYDFLFQMSAYDGRFRGVSSQIEKIELLKEILSPQENRNFSVSGKGNFKLDTIYEVYTNPNFVFRESFENAFLISDENFNYIGSFRQPPERTYYQKAKAQSKVDTDGAGYIDQIIEWEETDPDKLAELAKIMSELELFKEIKSNKFKGGRFELAVKTQTNSELAALTDVGFGISQFLPIIVADLQLGDNSCLALSQPEIHLHPKIQALFGNFLANQIKQTQKQYIVETHSEYLLNRIRLLLVKGELKPEDVRVYYFENDGVKTTTHQVEFATDGQIKGAPQGFFDTYAIDVLDIAMNSFAD